ncbi:hypothetical protein [Gemmata sp.]|uniref:hypothetical protein n=1 Tax=Gemmata sp. TaxID=1914242 RepID=UPI003F6F2450
MVDLATGELRVVVPVGFLLTEEQEVSVNIERPGGGSLPIRLKLIPARAASPAPDAQTPVAVPWPLRRYSPYSDDGYPEPDYGGGD